MAGVLGEKWDASGAPMVFTAEDGRKLTFTVFANGVTLSDGGGTTNVPHVEATADPNIILVAGVPFRRAAG